MVSNRQSNQPQQQEASMPELHVRLERGGKRYTFMPDNIDQANRLGLTDTFDVDQFEDFAKVCESRGWAMVDVSPDKQEVR